MGNLQTFERTEYQQVKADLHRKILDRLDLEKLGRTPGDAAREEVLVLIRNTVNSEAVPLSFAERERLAREILDEIFGLGPLEPLLKDPSISDILVNRYNRVYVERGGKLETTGLSFKDDQHLMQIIDRAEKNGVPVGDWSAERKRQLRTLISPEHLGRFRVLVQGIGPTVRNQ